MLSVRQFKVKILELWDHRSLLPPILPLPMLKAFVFLSPGEPGRGGVLSSEGRSEEQRVGDIAGDFENQIKEISFGFSSVLP